MGGSDRAVEHYDDYEIVSEICRCPGRREGEVGWDRMEGGGRKKGRALGNGCRAEASTVRGIEQQLAILGQRSPSESVEEAEAAGGAASVDSWWRSAVGALWCSIAIPSCAPRSRVASTTPGRCRTDALATFSETRPS